MFAAIYGISYVKPMVINFYIVKASGGSKPVVPISLVISWVTSWEYSKSTTFIISSTIRMLYLERSLCAR